MAEDAIDTPPAPRPTIGRIVHYRLTRADAADINRRREHGRGPDSAARLNSGAVVHVGATVTAGWLVPMIITAVAAGATADADTVNGQASLDGNDLLWVTCVRRGAGAGKWDWPPLG